MVKVTDVPEGYDGKEADNKHAQWKLIKAAICGASEGDTPPDPNPCDPKSLFAAADAFAYTQGVLAMCAEVFTKHAKSIAGEDGVWKGPTAEGFLSYMEKNGKAVKGLATAIGGKSDYELLGNKGSLPEALLKAGNHLQWAQAEIERIDSFYAAEATRLGAGDNKDGTVTVSSQPEVVKLLNRDMQTVFDGLSKTYENTPKEVKTQGISIVPFSVNPTPPGGPPTQNPYDPSKFGPGGPGQYPPGGYQPSQPGGVPSYPGGGTPSFDPSNASPGSYSATPWDSAGANPMGFDSNAVKPFDAQGYSGAKTPDFTASPYPGSGGYPDLKTDPNGYTGSGFTPYSGSGVPDFASTTPNSFSTSAPGSGSDFGLGANPYGGSGLGAGGLGAGAGTFGSGVGAAGSGLGSGGGAAGAGLAGQSAGAGGPGMAGMGMGMPGAGVGAGGANGEQERERTTWLVEDLEVWGANPDLPPDVIGLSNDRPTQNRPN